jgi:hypothetical protein
MQPPRGQTVTPRRVPRSGRRGKRAHACRRLSGGDAPRNVSRWAPIDSRERKCESRMSNAAASDQAMRHGGSLMIAAAHRCLAAPEGPASLKA